MSKKQSQVTRELGKFAHALWLDLPMAMTQRLLGDSDENTLSTAGWKAYDAWVSLTNEATNQLYENPVVGAFTGRTMESALRLRQVSGTIASAFLNNLWPALGLPTADQVSRLRAEIASLQGVIEEVAVARNQNVPQAAAHRSAEEGLKLVRGHGHAQRTHEEKANAAA
jgi:hypothetical protein